MLKLLLVGKTESDREFISKRYKRVKLVINSYICKIYRVGLRISCAVKPWKVARHTFSKFRRVIKPYLHSHNNHDNTTGRKIFGLLWHFITSCVSHYSETITLQGHCACIMIAVQL